MKPECLLPLPTWRERCRRLLARHIPHKTRSGSCWCLPVWWTVLFGGSYDSGNGYGWNPPMTPRRFVEVCRSRVTVLRSRLAYWRMRRRRQDEAWATVSRVAQSYYDRP